jgi:hypothetical protein
MDTKKMNVQLSSAWFDDRCGKFTASNFYKLMTRPRNKNDVIGKTALAYIHDVFVESITGQPKMLPNMDSLKWGTQIEPIAKKQFEFATFMPIRNVGFIHIDQLVGGSPDGLIANDSIIEIKCPWNQSIHLQNLFLGTVPKKYIWQCQGLMWITGRINCYFVSFDPRQKKDLQLSIVNLKRDENKINLLKNNINIAKKILAKKMELYNGQIGYANR